MQIAELSAYLELVPREDADRRAIKAAGIGNGQTIAGSVSGNTHGAQITFGAMPDFVAGLHIATGSGRTLWIERASRPVFNEEFAAKIDAELIRDDDIFNAAVVSFGTFGVVLAMAVETAPIYQLEFPPIADIKHDDLKAKLSLVRPDAATGSVSLRVHLRPLQPQADRDGGERTEGALQARRADAEASLDTPRQERLRAWHQHPSSRRHVSVPGATARHHRLRVQALPQERAAGQCPRLPRADLHLVDLLPGGLHRERMGRLGERRRGDDRHRLGGRS